MFQPVTSENSCTGTDVRNTSVLVNSTVFSSPETNVGSGIKQNVFANTMLPFSLTGTAVNNPSNAGLFGNTSQNVLFGTSKQPTVFGNSPLNSKPIGENSTHSITFGMTPTFKFSVPTTKSSPQTTAVEHTFPSFGSPATTLKSVEKSQVTTSVAPTFTSFGSVSSKLNIFSSANSVGGSSENLFQNKPLGFSSNVNETTPKLFTLGNKSLEPNQPNFGFIPRNIGSNSNDSLISMDSNSNSQPSQNIFGVLKSSNFKSSFAGSPLFSNVKTSEITSKPIISYDSSNPLQNKDASVQNSPNFFANAITKNSLFHDKKLSETTKILPTMSVEQNKDKVQPKTIFQSHQSSIFTESPKKIEGLFKIPTSASPIVTNVGDEHSSTLKSVSKDSLQQEEKEYCKKMFSNYFQKREGKHRQGGRSIRRSEDKEVQRKSWRTSSRTEDRKKKESSLQMNVQNMACLVCRGIHADDNKKEVLMKHFSKFGKVVKVSCSLSQQQAYIWFDDHESASQAKMHGTLISRVHNPVSLFWCRKEAPVKSRKRHASVSDIKDELKSMLEGAGDHKLLKRPLEKDESSDDNQCETTEKSPKKVKSSGSSTSDDSSPRAKKYQIWKRSSKNSSNKTSEQKEVGKSKRSEEKSVKISEELITEMLQPANTPEEKFSVLNARDKLMRMNLPKQSDLSRAKLYKGSCPDMCPEKERYSRYCTNSLSVYERNVLTSSKIDHKIIIKEYSRSSADQEEPLLHDLRTPESLELTLDFLLCNLIDKFDENQTKNQNCGEWYNFIWNRTRAIRKDITQQHLCDNRSVEIMEKCTRFHIHCAAALCHEDPSIFDPKINNENLTKCLQTLKHLYEDLAVQNIKCDNEPEFRAYDILLHLKEGDETLRLVQKLSVNVRNSPEVRFAVAANLSFINHNYVHFFKLVEKATYFNACILHRYFAEIRILALRIMIKAYCIPNRSDQIPLEDIVRLLKFENFEDASQFCMALGLKTVEKNLVLDRVNFTVPVNALPPCKSPLVIESKLKCSLGEAINNGPLSRHRIDSYIPHNSFDENNCLKTEAYLAIDQSVTDVEISKVREKIKSKRQQKKPVTDSSINEVPLSAATNDDVNIASSALDKNISKLESTLMPSVNRLEILKQAELLPATDINQVPLDSVMVQSVASTNQKANFFIPSSEKSPFSFTKVQSVAYTDQESEKIPIPSCGKSPFSFKVQSVDSIDQKKEKFFIPSSEKSPFSFTKNDGEFSQGKMSIQQVEMKAVTGEDEKKASKQILDTVVNDVVQDVIRNITSEVLEEKTEEKAEEIDYNKLANTMSNDLILDVVKEEIEAIVREKMLILRRMRLNSLSSIALKSIINSTVKGLVMDIVIEIHDHEAKKITAEYEKKRRLMQIRMEKKKEALKRLCARKVLRKWHDIVIQRQQLKEKLYTDCPFSQYTVKSRADIVLSHPIEAAIISHTNNYLFESSVITRTLKEELSWSPLDLGPLFNDAFCEGIEFPPLHGKAKFWKLLLLYINEEDITEEEAIFNQWISAKFTKGYSSETDTDTKICSLYWLTDSSSFQLAVCVRSVAINSKTFETTLSKLKNGTLFDGITAVLVFLPPKMSQKFSEMHGSYLKKLLEEKPKIPYVPLYLLNFVLESSSSPTACCLADLKEHNLVSEYLNESIKFSDFLQLSEKVTDAVRWLITRCPEVPTLVTQYFKDYFQDGVMQVFNLVFQDVLHKKSQNYFYQDPNSIISLFNENIEHRYLVLSSSTLQTISGPIPEIEETDNHVLSWRNRDIMQKVWKIMCMCRLPSFSGYPLSLQDAFSYVQQAANDCNTNSFSLLSSINILLRKASPIGNTQDYFIPWADIIYECIQHFFPFLDQDFEVNYLQDELESLDLRERWHVILESSPVLEFCDNPLEIDIADENSSATSSKQKLEIFEYSSSQSSPAVNEKQNRSIEVELKLALESEKKEGEAFTSMLSQALDSFNDSDVCADILVPSPERRQNASRNFSYESESHCDTDDSSEDYCDLEDKIRELKQKLESEKKAEKAFSVTLESLLI